MRALASTHNSFVQNLSGSRILGVEQVIEKERLEPSRVRTGYKGLGRVHWFVDNAEKVTLRFSTLWTSTQTRGGSRDGFSGECLARCVK